MADVKYTDMPGTGTPARTDLVALTLDPGGTPATDALPIARILELAEADDISDATTAGKTLLTAANAGAQLAALGASPAARSIATQHSLTGGGNLSADRTLALVNDTATPGANKVYGTDGSGVRGWKNDPAGGGGGASGAYAGTRTVAINGDITLADVGGLVILTDASVQTLDPSGVSEGQWIDLLNNTTDKTGTIAATGGIGDGGTASFALPPRSLVRVVRMSETAPYWRAGHDVTVALGENEAAVAKDDGSNQVEARAQVVAWDLGREDIDADGTFTLGEWYQPWPGRILEWRVATDGGTCDAVIKYDGSAAPGFGLAQALSTTPQTITGDPIDLTNHKKITVTVSNQSNLAGLRVWAVVLRTGP